LLGRSFPSTPPLAPPPRTPPPPLKFNVEVEIMINKCLECGSEFYCKPAEVKRGGGKYCSLSCSATAGNRIRKEKGVYVYCETCGKRIYRIKSQIKRSKTNTFYCDRNCKKNSEHKGNKRVKKLGFHRKAHLKQKEALLKKHGVQCQFLGCDLELYDNRELIDMHHFGDSLDHSKTKLLCPYHHRLADKGIIKVGDFAENNLGDEDIRDLR